MSDVSSSHGRDKKLLRGIRKALKKRRMVLVMEDRFEIIQARTDRSMNRKVAKVFAGIDDFAEVTMLLPDNVRLSAENLLDIWGEGNDEQRSSMFEYMRLHKTTTEFERNGGELDDLMDKLSQHGGGEEEEEYEGDIDVKLPGYC